MTLCSLKERKRKKESEKKKIYLYKYKYTHKRFSEVRGQITHKQKKMRI